MTQPAERPAQAPVEGVLCVDKPLGWTSRDVVNKVGGLLGDRHAGHAGTLDPAASGVLLVAFGEATKAVRWLMDAPKTYEAEVLFGAATLSDDATGAVIRRAPVPQPLTMARLQAELDRRRGKTLQVPPAVSALQRAGVRDHQRVRRGEEVARDPRQVWLGHAQVLSVTGAVARLRIECGAGFYVRALARDLGEALGSAAHLASLRRVSGGGFDLARAVTLETLTRAEPEARRAWLVPAGEVLAGLLPVLEANAAVTRALGQGKRPSLAALLPDEGALPELQVGTEVLVLEAGTRAPVCVATVEPAPEGAEGNILKVVRGFAAAAEAASVAAPALPESGAAEPGPSDATAPEPVGGHAAG